MNKIYVYKAVVCVFMSFCLSVRPADQENGVSKLLQNHTTLLGIKKK